MWRKTIWENNKANNYNGYMVCLNRKRINEVMELANKLKCCINFPITFDEFLKKEYYGRSVNKFYIDDLDLLITSLSDVPIETASITFQKEEIKHSQDIIETFDDLIERFEHLFGKGKIYKGEDILLMLNKIKSNVREVF
jgi:hypothetical protein